MQNYKNAMFRHVVPTCRRGTIHTNANRTRTSSWRSVATRMTSGAPSSANAVSREELLDEAAFLSKSLYRSCIRSVRLIRWGNDFDEKEFERREEEWQNPTAGGVISMAPPPDKEDELRSRADYYHSYAREYFTQESDGLDDDPLLERDFRRYLYYLRKGEKDRKWLLGDMMFPDPYKNSLDQERVKRFEVMSKRYLGEEVEEDVINILDDVKEQNDTDSTSSNSSNNDGFIEDEDPDWFQKKYPHLQ